MSELIERLEKATGPDRELDAMLATVLDPNLVVSRAGFAGYVELPDIDFDIPAREYTDSIDAAAMLVPEGCFFDTQSILRGTGLFDKPLAWAQVEETSGPMIVQHAAPTLPLAICIAALKARALLSKDDGAAVK